MIESTMIAAEEKKEIELRSTCEQPEAFSEEKVKLLLKK